MGRIGESGSSITGNGAATATAGTVTTHLVSLPFVGATTGTAIIGAYGLGILPADLAVNDSVTSLDGNPLSPPNNVVFSVTGLDITAGDFTRQYQTEENSDNAG